MTLGLVEPVFSPGRDERVFEDARTEQYKTKSVDSTDYVLKVESALLLHSIELYQKLQVVYSFSRDKYEITDQDILQLHQCVILYSLNNPHSSDKLSNAIDFVICS